MKTREMKEKPVLQKRGEWAAKPDWELINNLVSTSLYPVVPTLLLLALVLAYSDYHWFEWLFILNIAITEMMPEHSTSTDSLLEPTGSHMTPRAFK